MPKTDEPENQKKPESYKFTLRGVTPGTAYSLYLNSDPRRYSQGTISGDTLLVEIPSSLSGPGYINLTTPRIDRLTFGSTYTHRFNLDQNLTISFQDIVQPVAPPLTPNELPEDSKKKRASNKLLEEVQEAKAESVQEEQTQQPEKKSLRPKKKLLTNKLRDQVQVAKNEGLDLQAKEVEPAEENSEDKPKETFWDRFK